MKLAATIASVHADHVLLRCRDGREWKLDIRDVPSELTFENQPVYIEHDSLGYATAISPRQREPLPEQIRESIEAVSEWAESLQDSSASML
jgi:hypothetical protein